MHQPPICVSSTLRLASNYFCTNWLYLEQETILCCAAADGDASPRFPPNWILPYIALSKEEIWKRSLVKTGHFWLPIGLSHFKPKCSLSGIWLEGDRRWQEEHIQCVLASKLPIKEKRNAVIYSMFNLEAQQIGWYCPKLKPESWCRHFTCAMCILSVCNFNVHLAHIL